MKYLSLFSGIGCFELALKQYNESKCIGYSEIDTFAKSIYKYHFKQHSNLGDIYNVSEKSLPQFDLLTAGFPCQPFSVSGKKQEFREKKGNLFFEIIRILRVCQPKHFILENVEHLLHIRHGKVFNTILNEISDCGYISEWNVFDSSEFGLPQNRKRIFIIGHLAKECSSVFLHKYAKNKKYTKEKTKIYKSILSKNNFQSFKIDKPTGIYRCIMTSKNAYIHTDQGVRQPTMIELERIQGLPDNYTKYGLDENNNLIEISKTQRQKCIGNGISINVIDYIFKMLSEHLNEHPKIHQTYQ